MRNALVAAALLLATPFGAAAAGPIRLVQFDELTIFQNGNVDEVQSGPRAPTIFQINRPYVITYINTYHYFGGGMPPGQIGLRSNETGRMYGPWQAFGEVGQGGVANATWVVRPDIRIPPGSYAIVDSYPATWSCNAGSGFAGFSVVKGFPGH